MVGIVRGRLMSVYFLSSVQDYTGGDKSLELGFGAGEGEARDLNALIDLLGARYGEGFRDFVNGEGNCFFLVNGSGVAARGGLGAPLAPGDKVEILPFVQGG